MPSSFSLVADDRRNARAETLGPAVTLGGPHDGRHVGAAAGDQDHDVLHGRRDYLCSAAAEQPVADADRDPSVIEAFDEEGAGIAPKE